VVALSTSGSGVLCSTARTVPELGTPSSIQRVVVFAVSDKEIHDFQEDERRRKPVTTKPARQVLGGNLKLLAERVIAADKLGRPAKRPTANRVISHARGNPTLSFVDDLNLGQVLVVIAD